MAGAPDGVLAVENPDYELGMLTSLQAGLRAVPADSDGVMFTLVDHPAIAASTVAALIAGALNQSDAPVVIPRFAGKRGHPVLIRRSIMAEFLNEPITSKVRDVIDRHTAEIVYLEVEDPGILDDVDDPAAYEALVNHEA